MATLRAKATKLRRAMPHKAFGRHALVRHLFEHVKDEVRTGKVPPKKY